MAAANKTVSNSLMTIAVSVSKLIFPTSFLRRCGAKLLYIEIPAMGMTENHIILV